MSIFLSLYRVYIPTVFLVLFVCNIYILIVIKVDYNIIKVDYNIIKVDYIYYIQQA
jgi:hypothetical protein